MEPKKARPAAEATGLSIADKQIDAIIQSHLPPAPHLLSVPTDYPYRPEFPYENKNTSAAHLFESWELRKLQYMTLVSHGDRGVGLAQGNWEDEINAQSPQSLSLASSTATPNPHKQPKVKLSVAEYKKVRNGEMAMPKASASPPETKKQEERKQIQRPSQTHSHPQVTNESAKPRPVADDKRNGSLPASLPKKPELKVTSRDHNGHLPPKTGRPEPREADKAIPRTNGRVDRPKNDPPKSKDTTPARPSPRPDSAQKSRDPPKPSSSTRPSSNIWDTKTNKRPLEASSRESLHPEKRTKTENGHTRTPFGSRNITPSRPSEAKAPFRPGHSRSASNLSHVSPSQASQPTKKAAPTSNPSDKKSQSSKLPAGKPPNSLPPLLSPLPTDIGVSSTGASAFDFLETLQSDDHTPPKTPKKGTGADSKPKHDSPFSSPLSTPPKSQSSRGLPPPLSPTLPDVLEQELAKLQQKSAIQSTQAATDAAIAVPKVAKAKVGHPPKKERQSDPPKSRVGDEKESLTVKIRYKKKYSRDIERILALKPAPTKSFKVLEAQRLAAERQAHQPAIQPKFDEDSSEEDVPPVTSKPSLARKRPVESTDPAPKRPKISENLDVTKTSTPVTPAFRSPGPAGASQKNILATPKKGDAMKSAIGSVAMRKVESSDGHARTPQAATTSTPASAEKPRITNGDARPEYDKLGLKLKRKMDTILKTKEPPAMRNMISDDQRKLGLCVGLECIAAYMLNAHSAGRSEVNAGRPRLSLQWEQVIALWDFIDHQCRGRPPLHALSTQMGAICFNQLQEIYIETNDSKSQGNWKKLGLQWKSAYAKRKDLPGYGRYPEIKELGSWSSVFDATNLVYAVLERFTEKEKDIKWQRER